MAQDFFRKELLTRREFVRLAGAGALSLTSLGALSGCSNRASGRIRGGREIVDDAGRTVTIPAKDDLERIFFTSALAEIFCFTVDPDMAIGTGYQFTPQEFELLPARLAELPYLGSLSGGGEIDRESLLVEDVQLIFSVSGTPLTEANISDAEKLQGMTEIPVVLVDGSFERIAAAYRLLGECMGRESRAEELAVYCERVFAEVSDAVAKVPESERVSVYYAEGPEGLQTEPSISMHAVALSMAGAVNVAQVPLTTGVGMSNVSLEQVLQWDPEVIVAWDDEVRGGADDDIRTNPDWAPIRAVKDGRVYTMPNIPFAWLDRPPGVNRLIGIQWMANLLYPQAYDIDIIEVTKDFYSKMYWVEIDDARVIEILGNSYPPPGTKGSR